MITLGVDLLLVMDGVGVDQFVSDVVDESGVDDTFCILFTKDLTLLPPRY